MTDLNKLSTQRILNIFRKKRKQLNTFYNAFYCECCGELLIDEKELKILKEKENILLKEVNSLKKTLSKREHIEK